MRFSAQRFPIMSASICHTWLEQKEKEGRRQQRKWERGGSYDLTLTKLKYQLTWSFLIPALLFSFFFPSLCIPGAWGCRWQSRKEGIEFHLIHLQLMVHSYSVEAWPIHTHLHCYTFRYANISSAEDSLFKQMQANLTPQREEHTHI